MAALSQYNVNKIPSSHSTSKTEHVTLLIQTQVMNYTLFKTPIVNHSGGKFCFCMTAYI